MYAACIHISIVTLANLFTKINKNVTNQCKKINWEEK